MADLDSSRRFFTDTLGFHVSDTIEDNIAWLRCDRDHHAVALLNAGFPKPHHYAYELADWNEIKKICDHLSRNDVPIIYGPSRHGPGHNLFLYIPDPAGNIIELFAEIDLIADEEGFEPLTWENTARTLDVWRGIMPPAHFLAGDARPFHDWSAGSPVIGAGWSVFEAGEFEALDPAAVITAPTSAQPEFQIDIPRFTLGAANPLDHAKAMVYTDSRFATGAGFSFSGEMAVKVHNTDGNPYDADPDDPRLGSGSLALLDDSTGVVLNFEVSNRLDGTARDLCGQRAGR